MDLEKVLADHVKWLTNNDGVKANLRRADLRKANLREADFRKADFRGADLRKANLRGANLREANLRVADFRGADLYETCIKTFQFQKHLAICTGERLTIGCEDYSLSEWVNFYEEIGTEHDYSPFQIKMYGNFIQMCLEAAADEADKK